MNTHKTLLAGTLAAASTLVAQAAGAQEIRTTQTRPSQSMLSSGVMAFGIPYVASVVVAAESKHAGDHDLYVPVAGPWMDLADRHCTIGEDCHHEGLYKGLLIVDGIFQGIGALDIVGAFLFPETVTTAASRPAPRTALQRFRISPTVAGSGGVGLVAAGAF